MKQNLGMAPTGQKLIILNTSRRYMGGVGADNTACLAYGGQMYTSGGTQQALTGMERNKLD